MNVDTYRDAFLRFVAEGMTHAESMEQFDKELWRLAMWEELDSGHAIRNSVGDFVTNDERGLPALFELSAMASFEARNSVGSHDMDQAMALWASGWTSEVPNPNNSKDFWRQPQVMSFYWRAPSKRPGKPGRRYLSTNQAFNAMQKTLV